MKGSPDCYETCPTIDGARRPRRKIRHLAGATLTIDTAVTPELRSRKRAQLTSEMLPGMLRRILAAICVVAILAPLQAQVVLATYASGCSSGDQDEYNYAEFDRYRSGPGMTGVVGIPTVVDLRLCYSPTSDYGDSPLVLTTLQRDIYYEGYIVQLGYAQCGEIVDCSQNGPGLAIPTTGPSTLSIPTTTTQREPCSSPMDGMETHR